VGGASDLINSIEIETGGNIWNSGVQTKKNKIRMAVAKFSVVSTMILALFLCVLPIPKGFRFLTTLPVVIGTVTGGQLIVGC
jgi:hypothetical protein